ncbi:MAG: LysM peptidoglycan-binding domain-containing protein [Bacteroidota bacterium]
MKQSLRQFGTAIAISIVSLGLVLGGLSLALSESFTPLAPTETAAAPTRPVTLTVTRTPLILTGTAATGATQSSTTQAPTPTSTGVPPSACPPPSGWIGVMVGSNDTLESLALRYNTSAQMLAQGNCLLTQTLLPGTVLYVPPLPTMYIPPVRTATFIPCGAPFGWVRYMVQPGDTLYHIATLYGITTSQLQRANCLGLSTTIRVGQLLWVPNVPTLTLPATMPPPYDTPTPYPTEPLTETPLPFTSSPEPTSTSVPSDTSVPPGS